MPSIMIFITDEDALDQMDLLYPLSSSHTALEDWCERTTKTPVMWHLQSGGLWMTLEDSGMCPFNIPHEKGSLTIIVIS